MTWTIRPLEALCAEPRVLEPWALRIAAPNPGHNYVAGLVELLSTLPRLKLAVEVGSYRGVSTETLLHFADHVIAVDPWSEPEFARAKREFEGRLGDCPRLSYLRMPSLQAAELVAPFAADLIYIDADHSYEAVRSDIEAWRRKVRHRGWLAGHDYIAMANADVVRAVDEAFGGGVRIFADYSWLVQL